MLLQFSDRITRYPITFWLILFGLLIGILTGLFIGFHYVQATDDEQARQNFYERASDERGPSASFSTLTRSTEAVSTTQVNNGNPQVNRNIQSLQWLADIPAEQALSELTFLVQDSALEVRLAAINLIEIIDHPEAGRMLASLLQDEELAVRRQAINGLAILAQVETQDAVEPHLFADDQQIQLSAIETLVAIGERRSLPLLGQLLYVQNPVIRRQALAALGEISQANLAKAEIISLVTPLTSDEDEKIRRLAREILAEQVDLNLKTAVER